MGHRRPEDRLLYDEAGSQDILQSSRQRSSSLQTRLQCRGHNLPGRKSDWQLCLVIASSCSQSLADLFCFVIATISTNAARSRLGCLPVSEKSLSSCQMSRRRLASRKSYKKVMNRSQGSRRGSSPQGTFRLSGPFLPASSEDCQRLTADLRSSGAFRCHGC